MALSTEDVRFLERCCIDRVIALELTSGEQFFAEVVFVIDQPPTPDIYVLRMQREADGTFTALGTAGESILIADIARIAPLPGLDYPEQAES